MTQRPTFQDLIERLREFIHWGSQFDSVEQNCRTPELSAQFNDLASALFNLQFEHVHSYRRFCQSRGVTADAITSWPDIPAIPAAAFKEYELTSLPTEERTKVFHSSGTTAQRPSRHFHNAKSLGLYEASLLPWFQRHLLPEVERLPLDPSPPTCVGATRSPSGGERDGVRSSRRGSRSRREASRQGRPPPSFPSASRFRFVILTPSPGLAPHSSLVHMFETVRREFGSSDSVFAGTLDSNRGWVLDKELAWSRLVQAKNPQEPVLVLGTALSFAELLGWLGENHRRVCLPPGSRALETGGYKGRSRALSKNELHALITERLGIPATDIVGEYGMSELSSQAYDGVADVLKSKIKNQKSKIPERVFRFPPWAQVQILSPETGQEAADGETGLIRIFDLANVRSVMAVQTEDLAVRHADGFELIGRAHWAEPRGCSFMVNEPTQLFSR